MLKELFEKLRGKNKEQEVKPAAPAEKEPECACKESECACKEPEKEAEKETGKVMVSTNIEEAIARIDDWKGKKVTYEPVAGGITNPNFKVFVDGTPVFLKIPGAGTDFIDRDNCHIANEIASHCEAGPEVLYYFGDTGVEVFSWLEGYRQVTFGDVYDEKIFNKIVKAIKAFHAGTEKMPLVESVFDQTRDMVARAKEGKYLPPWHDKMMYLMDKIEESFNNYGVELRPCHNDFWSNNMMYNEETDDLKIIDYEYASMGDPYYDLGVLTAINFMTEDMDVLVNKLYHGGVDDEYGFARMKLNKICADVKWSYWSLYQAIGSDLTDYMAWYGPKIARLQHMWTDPRLDLWLNKLNGKTPFYTK